MPSPGQPEDGKRHSFGLLVSLLLEQRGSLLLAGLLSAAGAAAALTQPVLVNKLVTTVQADGDVTVLTALVCVMLLVTGLLSALQQYVLQRLGEGVVRSARRTVVARLMRLPVAEFDRRRSGDLVARVSSDTTALRLALTQTLVAAVGGVLTMIGALIAMIVIDAVLVGLTAVVVLGSIVLVVTLARTVRKASQDVQTAMGVLTASLDRAVRAVRTIRAANAVEREEERILGHVTTSWRAGVRLARASAVIEPMAMIAMQASLLVVLGAGGYRVAAGDLPVADLISFLLFLFLLVMPLGQIFGAVSAVGSALGALDRITEILGLPTEGAATTRTRTHAEPSPAAVTFEKVTFRYPEAGQAALDEVSFEIATGERVALVGPSGAGKSTTLQLVERFYDPEGGRVLVRGADSRELPHNEVRASIGYVEQDAPALAGTLRDNLTLGAPEATTAECEAILRSVNLGDLLDRDGGGLDVEVGENGVTLSGGERQRLSIARALLPRPSILLLDESTSNLDGRNEQLAREAINRVSADCTLVIVAHRLSTVVDADKIIVFDGGQVVAQGTHEELLVASELYRELAHHQLLD
ncbi:ABC transporter ATP-binding protein [Actinoplanes sp. NPDC051861]|uniref:ABC transporter ATP-binding protein n=1 Tax=Actinoplanes sp. NPDC051861 TaxID=3155170 RepID=UPI003438AF66